MTRGAALFLLLTGVAFAQRPPVILVDGYHLLCQSDDLNAANTFGDLDKRLAAEGVQTAFFPTCAFSGKPSIEDLGNALAAKINSLNVPQVDLVTHSMGGLIVRSYLAGKKPAPGVFKPPVDPKIRKWVSIATPNFGAMIPPIAIDYLPDIQAKELVPGSQFLFDLATWNQNHDDLRGVDAVGIIGNAGGFGPLDGASDGTVAVTSASLSYAEPDDRTRILPYCHGTSVFNSILGFGCSAPPLAKMQADNPLSWQIIDSFLARTDAWRSVGHSPSQDKLLSQYGGLLSQARDKMGQPSGPITDQNFVQGGVVGTYSVVLLKPGPFIAGVFPSAARLPFLSLAPRMLISIYGSGLTGATVALDGQVLPVNYASDVQINALLPENVSGLRQLTVNNDQGRAAVNVMVEDEAPAVFTMDGSGTGAAAAIRIQNFIALYLTGLGENATTPAVTLNGTPVNVTYAGRAPGYPGLDQINFELPAGVSTGTVVVFAGRHASNPVQLQ